MDNRRYSARECLDHVTSDQDARGNMEEPEIEEDVSEDEDVEEYDPEQDKESSEEEEEELLDGIDGEIFLSKDKKIAWSSVPHDAHGRARADNIIKKTPGPTLFAKARVQDIQSAFELFIPPSIQSILIDMTNKEGKRVYGDNWKVIDKTDLDAYVGLLLLAGVYRSNNEATASLWDVATGRSIFRATMSLQQFHVLSRVIRFDNRETRVDRRAGDKLAPIRELWEKWVERLPCMYNPGPNVTVDERLLPYRGRCPFKQYIPSKPAKYGIKIWAACDASSSYAWNMQVYTGKPAGGVPEKGQGKRVVLEMTKGLQGHNITCDNFFTSYALGEELRQRKLTMLGTVRRNKPELPAAITGIKDRAVLSSKFAFTATTTTVSYCPKKNKNVIVMSTLHRDAAVSSREDKKPDIILEYNQTKGGVDNLDKVTGTYTCQRRTARWPMVVFHNILDVSAYNAFVLWMAINPGWNAQKTFKRRLFLEELGRALTTPHIERRTRIPRAPASADLMREVQAQSSSRPAGPPPPEGTKGSRKRQRCHHCPSSKDNKTSTTCDKCGKYICPQHTHTVKSCHSCI